MTNSVKAIKRIRNIKIYQENYLNQIKKATDIVPVVEKNLEWVKWAEDTVQHSPDIFDKVGIENEFSLIEDSIKSNLPDLSFNVREISGTVNAANASLSAIVFNKINAETKDLDDTSMINQSIQKYYTLQNKQNTVQDVAKLLSNIDKKGEFLLAVEKYSKVSSGIATPQDAATLMRNMLEGYKGELFQLLRKNSFVNQSKKNLQWDDISKYLAIGSSGSYQSKLLLAEKDNYTNIHLNLSNILKNEVVNPSELINEYFARWLNFFYTTLNLIEPKYL